MGGRSVWLGLIIVVGVALPVGPAQAAGGAAPENAVRLLYAADEICLVQGKPGGFSGRRRVSGWRDPVISILAVPASRRLARCQSRVGVVRCLGGRG